MGKLSTKARDTLGYTFGALWCAAWTIVFLIFSIVMAVNDQHSHLIEKVLGVGAIAFLATIFVVGTIHGFTEFARQRRKAGEK